MHTNGDAQCAAADKETKNPALPPTQNAATNNPDHRYQLELCANEPLLYGVDRVHDLRDVYREYLAGHPEIAAQLRAERPAGPLAVTHTRRGIECRYDAIYASPEFAVEGVDHLWDEAREAGSDHALVRAVLCWRSS